MLEEATDAVEKGIVNFSMRMGSDRAGVLLLILDFN
jgi:hypothetical protein